jgi:hypothetical protein
VYASSENMPSRLRCLPVAAAEMPNAPNRPVGARTR